MSLTWRFDDVSVNTDLEHLFALIATIKQQRPDAKILLAISPIVFSGRQLRVGQKQRVHPSSFTALSALHPYYKGESCGVPYIHQQEFIELAGHGLAHVDHRLLNRQAQELSIVSSCALAQSKTFIPPYNHWNEDTEWVCTKHGITIVKFEDGWLHALYNPYEPDHLRYYAHPFDFTPEQLKSWFEQ